MEKGGRDTDYEEVIDDEVDPRVKVCRTEWFDLGNISK